jgi:sulfite dehydrogenase (quinone) subunit SoeC
VATVPQPSLIARNDFRIGYTAQEEWAWLITAAFFFGSVGAGLFLVSYFAGFWEGALAGLLSVAVLKSIAHVLFLGKPLRAWRAVARWRTSWISRGLIAIGLFVVFGSLYLAVPAGPARFVFGVVAAVAAGFVTVYDGFVMRASRGIPAWNSWLVPVIVACYAAIGGTTCALLLRVATGDHFSRSQIEGIEIGVLALNVVLIGLYGAWMHSRTGAAALAMQRLTSGRLGLAFVAGALVVGLGVALALAVVAATTGSTPVLALADVADLAGHFTMFFALLRAGTYEPARPLVPAT